MEIQDYLQPGRGNHEVRDYELANPSRHSAVMLRHTDGFIYDSYPFVLLSCIVPCIYILRTPAATHTFIRPNPVKRQKGSSIHETYWSETVPFLQHHGHVSVTCWHVTGGAVHARLGKAWVGIQEFPLITPIITWLPFAKKLGWMSNGISARSARVVL